MFSACEFFRCFDQCWGDFIHVLCIVSHLSFFCLSPMFMALFHIPISSRAPRLLHTLHPFASPYQLPRGTAGRSPVQLICCYLNSLLTLVFFYIIEQWDELLPELWNILSQLFFSDSSSTSSSSGSRAISRGTKASNQPSSISSPKPPQIASELPMVCSSDCSRLHLNDSAPVHGTVRNRGKKLIR